MLVTPPSGHMDLLAEVLWPPVAPGARIVSAPYLPAREQYLWAMLSGLYYTDMTAFVNNNYPAVQDCRTCLNIKNMSKTGNEDFGYIGCSFTMMITMM